MAPPMCASLGHPAVRPMGSIQCVPVNGSVVTGVRLQVMHYEADTINMHYIRACRSADRAHPVKRVSGPVCPIFRLAAVGRAWAERGASNLCERVSDTRCAACSALRLRRVRAPDTGGLPAVRGGDDRGERRRTPITAGAAQCAIAIPRFCSLDLTLALIRQTDSHRLVVLGCGEDVPFRMDESGQSK